MNIAIGNLNFGKKFLSKTSVQKIEGGECELAFVEYEPANVADREQIQRLNVLWQPDGKYMGTIANGFCGARCVSCGHYYGLEDKTGATLAIAETSEEKKFLLNSVGKKSCVNINYIQAHPDEIFSSKNRVYKGLGGALVSSIVKKAQDEKKYCVELKSANEAFWAQSGYFKVVGMEGGLPVRDLSKKDFGRYIKYVEEKRN